MADREGAPGAVRQITSLTNPLVKDIRALARKPSRYARAAAKAAQAHHDHAPAIKLAHD